MNIDDPIPPPPPPPSPPPRIEGEEGSDQSTGSDEDDSSGDDRRILECLNRKINDQDQPPDSSLIPEVNRHELDDPQTLAEKYKPNDKNEWLFFVRQNKREGYWSAAGRTDSSIMQSGEEIGSSKKMEYCTGTPPHGTKTDWTMLEYKATEKDEASSSDNNPTRVNDWVLCKISKQVNKKRKLQEIMPKGDEEGGVMELIGIEELDSYPLPVPFETEGQVEDPPTPVLGLIEPGYLGENPPIDPAGGALEEQIIPGQQIDLNPMPNPNQIDNQVGLALAPILGLHAMHQGENPLNPNPWPIQARIPGLIAQLENGPGGMPLDIDMQRVDLDEAMEIMRRYPAAFPPPPPNIDPP